MDLTHCSAGMAMGSGSSKSIEKMSEINLHFQLPENLKVEKFIERLGKKVSLEIVTQQYCLKRFYDSFDWRLYNAGLLCELNQSKTDSQLSLRELSGGRVIATTQIEEVPAFVNEVSDQTLKSKLAPLLEMRALLSLTSQPYRAYRINLLNKERKTTVRLLIEDFELLPAQICIGPIKGYDKAARQLSRLLEKKLGLKLVKKNLLQAALKLQGRKPQDYSSKLNIQLDPQMRADISCKYIYSHLLQSIKVNETGVIADIDSEFLHDFRVAVRRTRAGMGQLKEILPVKVTGDFADFFAWLGQITCLSRDLDVYLLNFAGYQKSLPANMRKDIEPLYDFIKSKRTKAQKELVDKLKSTEYLSKLRAWEDYLKESAPKKPTEADAMTPIKKIADKRIRKVYRRVIREGNAISDQSPAEALHDLRKTCKKLRYLMEFFQSLYPEKKVDLLIKELKKFQTILGDFQDYEVQEQTLKKFADEMMAEQSSADTFIAMGVLVQNLHEQKLRARQAFASCFERFKQAENQAVSEALFAGKNQEKS